MTDDLIDTSVFEELADSVGADFAAELVETFLSDAASMFEGLNTALADQDEDGYRRAAHSIKSNAQTFGATALAAKAREIELAGTFDAAAVATLQTTYEASATALESLLND
jgi:HPt (histidine-containing phosphotransfer) domain-containing protein